MVFGWTEVEDVEGVARPERKLDVDAAEQSCKPAVLVLGVDQEDLDAAAQRRHRQCRQQVGLARARVSEHCDVCVGVARVVEGIECDWAAGGSIRTDREAAYLPQLCM